MRKENPEVLGTQVFQKSLNGSILKNPLKKVSGEKFKDNTILRSQNLRSQNSQISEKAK